MLDFTKEVLAGGGATATVSALLNPIDVIKTRRQLPANSRVAALDIARDLWREGGLVALWRPGLGATVAREMVYSGACKGLYPLTRDMLCPTGSDPALHHRAAAAAATGFGGSIFANALDLVRPLRALGSAGTLPRARRPRVPVARAGQNTPV